MLQKRPNRRWRFFAAVIITCLSTISLTPFNSLANRISLVTLDSSSPVYADLSQPHRLLEPSYELPLRYVPWLQLLTTEYEVPLWLVARLVQVESSWNERAINRNRNGTYDYGLFQLNSDYIEYFEWKYSVEDLNPFNWKQSAEVAVKHLRKLYEATGSWYEATLAYNCGLSKLRSGSIPESSLRYADAIFAP